MFYRVKPSGEFTWNELSLSLDDDLFPQGFDLDRLEWKSVEESHHMNDVIAIALRHGTKTGTGIAFRGYFLYQVERPAMLRKSYADLERASAHPQIKATDELIERMAPGWIEHGELLDQRVQESSDDSIHGAQAEAQKILTAPLDPDLVDWWQQLGGPVV